MQASGVVLHQLADHSALGMPHTETRTEFAREREQVQFRAEFAVIATLGFLDPLKVFL